MSDQSFSKSSRLLSSTDFNYLKAKSHRKSNKWVRTYFKPTRLDSTNSRIGISVSKKVGKAHDRNRFKRIIREYFRTSKYRNLGLDVLIIVSPQITKEIETYKDREETLLKALESLFSGFKPAV